MSIEETHIKAEELLGKVLSSTQSPADRELLLLAMDALGFIWSTGQLYALEDYRKRHASEAPPPVVAAFDTRSEAEAWLNSQPEPPHGAYVLIGDSHHIVAHSREGNLRRLAPHPTLKYHLGRRNLFLGELPT